jgi:hypothetical protein
MNIEICKKCPNYPEYFADVQYDVKKLAVKFQGMDNNLKNVDCSFFINIEEVPTLLREIARKRYEHSYIDYIQSEHILKTYENNDCCLKLEQLVIEK